MTREHTPQGTMIDHVVQSIIEETSDRRQRDYTNQPYWVAQRICAGTPTLLKRELLSSIWSFFCPECERENKLFTLPEHRTIDCKFCQRP